jgi:hypothetical protein
MSAAGLCWRSAGCSYQTTHRIRVGTIDIRRIGCTIRLWVYADCVLRHEEAPIAVLESRDVCRITAAGRIVCSVSRRCDVIRVKDRIACGRVDWSGRIWISKIAIDGAGIIGVGITGEVEWQVAGGTCQ